MAAPEEKWTFVLTGLDGTKIGEVVDATERTVQIALSRPSTASFTMRPDNPFIPIIFEGDLLLQVWQGTKLRFNGPVISVQLANQEDGSNPSIAVNAASVAWRLSKRLAGLSISGSTYTALDKGEIAKKLIEETNALGETGIKIGATFKSESVGTYTAGPYKTTLSCINDLANGSDGFDWYVIPLQGGEAAPIGEWEAKPVYGSVKTTIFESGIGQSNVRQIGYLWDLSNVCNIAYHLPDEGLESVGAEVLENFEGTSNGERGRYEAVAELTGLTNKVLREKWLAENTKVRAQPRKVVSMTLDYQDGTGRVPTIETDYWLGDFVTARATLLNGIKTIFNGKVRIYQINVSLNSQGTAQITPVLVDDNNEL